MIVVFVFIPPPPLPTINVNVTTFAITVQHCWKVKKSRAAEAL